MNSHACSDIAVVATIAMNQLSNSPRLFIVQVSLAIWDDVDRIMSLIKDCIKDMESQGIYQWDQYYPTLEIIGDDLVTESMYVIKESNEIIGMIALNEEQPPEWGQINWSHQQGKILAVHRLAVNPKWQKQGIGGKLLDFAEKYAVDNDYASIRLDAYAANPRALELYEKHEYTRVGELHFPRRRLPFYCYEKTLGSGRRS
jgi:ribosomal protein S18 acetylase RimI-like enzyme